MTDAAYNLARQVLAKDAPEQRYADADEAWDSMGPAGLTEFYAVEAVVTARILAEALLAQSAPSEVAP